MHEIRGVASLIPMKLGATVLMLVMVGCSAATSEDIPDLSESGAGSGDVVRTRDGGQDAFSTYDPTDASIADASASDAHVTQDAGSRDAGLLLGRSCKDSSECAGYFGSDPAWCYNGGGAMSNRCTFDCWKLNSNQSPGQPLYYADPAKAKTCQEHGGECQPPEFWKRHVCVLP